MYEYKLQHNGKYVFVKIIVCSQTRESVVSKQKLVVSKQENLLFPNKRCCCFRARGFVVSNQENLLFPNKRCCCFRTRDLVASEQENLLPPNKKCCCFRTRDFVVSEQENVWIPKLQFFYCFRGEKIKCRGSSETSFGKV